MASSSGHDGAPLASEELFELKTIPFFGRSVSIILQNANGPCPLLAIANTLLLRNTVKLPERCLETRTVHVQQLLSVVAEHMLDANKETRLGGSVGVQGEEPLVATSPRTASELQLRTETIRQNISDAISILPKLLTGVDVNPRFSHCRAFEFTDEVAIFDLLDISLYHGWLYSPETEHAKCVSTLSYNQLVEKVIRWDVGEGRRRQKRQELQRAVEDSENQKQRYAAPMGPSEEDLSVQLSLSVLPREEGVGVSLRVQQACQGKKDRVAEIMEELDGLEEDESFAYECRVIQDFLEATSSQLTAGGLVALQEEMKEREIGVFFRNNHFSTLFRFQGKIFLLVSDSGYADVQECAWETLSDVSGNTSFVAGFTEDTGETAKLLVHQLQEEGDYALALQMQQAEQLEQEQLEAQERRRREEEQRRREIEIEQARGVVGGRGGGRSSSGKAKDKCSLM